MATQDYTNFSVGRDDAGVFRIVLNVPDKPMNVLDHNVMRELAQIVSELEQRDDVRLVVFKSSKESGFLAGADVEAIQAIRSPEQAERLIEQGQMLFSRIERLSMPTVAMLHGPCLGGGLELALACDYRIARDNSSTKIGLPEIKLGLIPGWGGTQRLPKRVGLRHALSLILTGKHLSASEALAIGLVDQAITPDQWRDEVVMLIDRLASGRSVGSFRGRTARLIAWIENLPIVRKFIFTKTEERLAKKAEHYPALFAAVRAIAASFYPNVNGYETERREFSTLIETQTCRQLIRLFFSRERARRLKTWTPDAVQVIHREPIRKLGVIGGGAMGAGIAQVAASKGYEVTVKELDAASVRAGIDRVDRLISHYSRHKGFSVEDASQLRHRIRVTDAPDAFAGVDCVVEAVVEKMDVKQAVLAEAERRIANASILATNTSALSVSEMAKSLRRPSHFAGLHFFNPVHRMELVEVVRGTETSDTTIAQLVAFVRSIGKTPIVTSDSPGFLVNRILFPYLGEAVLMVREGYKVGEIDREIRNFGMPMGPLELLDKVGLDVALHVAKTLRPILPDVDDVIEILAPLVERGQSGLKSGRGFYDYRGKQKAARTTPELVDFIDNQAQAADFADDGLSTVQRRLIYPMLAEAIRCEEEAVVQSAWAIDLAMVLGTGFAPHRGGPLSMIDQIGGDTVVTNLEQLRSQYGDRFTPPRKLLTGAER